MKQIIFIIMLFALVATCSQPSKPENENLKLWYTEPATEWSASLPIGNGRLVAMVFGGVDQEHLQLNEETLWSGGPHSYDNPDHAEILKKPWDLTEEIFQQVLPSKRMFVQ